MVKNFSLLAVAGVGVAWLALCGQAHSSLINHWKFDEAGGATTAADSAGSLPLTLQGDADFVADAQRGQVLDLDGNGDFASNSLEPFTSDITHTVAGWVFHDDFGDLTQRWISWGATSGGRYFIGPYAGQYIDDDGNVWWGLGTGNAKFTDTDAHPLQGTWQHWAFVREGTDARIYLDGQWVETLTIAAQTGISTGGDLRVGSQYSGTGGEFLDGRVDDLAIWNEALTPQQIKSARSLGAQNYLLIPEPATLLVWSLLAGLGIAAGRRRRRG